MYPHRLETSWMRQGMGYRREMALDSVGLGRAKRGLRKEQENGEKRAIFIFRSGGRRTKHECRRLQPQ
jgi:hypothetical protein